MGPGNEAICIYDVYWAYTMHKLSLVVFRMALCQKYDKYIVDGLSALYAK